MNTFFGWVETTALSTWLRESPELYAFPFMLILHAIGMGFLVGGSTMVNLRLLGFASEMKLTPVGRFFPVMWLAFWVNLASGLLLLIAYPTKGLTNPLFYLKLACIAAAVVILRKMQTGIFQSRDPESEGAAPRWKLRAKQSLALWLVALAAGRLLAYTYTRLMSADEWR